MEGKTACNNYAIDMTAAEFGACKNCGLKKLAHSTQATSNLKPSNEGSLKDRVKMFSQGNFTPAPTNLNKKPEPTKPVEKKSIVKEPVKPIPEKQPSPVKEIEKKEKKFAKNNDSDEEPQACDDFKIDVAATEFNTCINCHLHRKFHKENATSSSNRPSNIRKTIEAPKPMNLEKNAILKKTEELDRKEEERREKEKKEQEKKKEIETKKPLKEENHEKEDNKACSNFQIDVTAAEFNTCKNCHLLRKFHDNRALTSNTEIKPSGNSTLAEKMQKFNNPVSKQPTPKPQELSRSKTTAITRDSYIKEEQKPKEIIKGEEPQNNRLSNEPSQSISIVSGVPSIKERMKLLNEKKDAPKENVAAKEIRSANSGSVRDRAATLTALGLFAPKIEKPIEENNLEGITENNQGGGEITEEKKEEPIMNDVNLEKPIQKQKKTMSKRPEGMLFNDDEDDFATNIRKNSKSKPEEPKVQIQPKPIIENPPPVEIKKEPPQNTTTNNPPAKKKQLFSDSDSSSNSDSDDMDPREKELKERLARMQANKLNK